MANKYEKGPHLLILAEDNIYREFAIGFSDHFAVRRNKIHIDDIAGGWPKLRRIFENEYVKSLTDYPNKYALLLLDLDKSNTRYNKICAKIPSSIKDRVFILSCHDEAERLKANLGGGKAEPVGHCLAECCYQGSYATSGNPWLCPELLHNSEELTRMVTTVRPFLFPQGLRI